MKDFLAPVVVKIGSRFVKQPNVRVNTQEDCELQALPHARGKIFCADGAESLKVKPDAFTEL